MSDLAWIDAALGAARPQAMAALLRYFRDLDFAEEAFQEACLRALKAWPKNGPPRDPTAWLVFVGRNAAVDTVRRRAREVELPDEVALSDLGDAEADLAERLDGGDYRDAINNKKAVVKLLCHETLGGMSAFAARHLRRVVRAQVLLHRRNQLWQVLLRVGL